MTCLDNWSKTTEKVFRNSLKYDSNRVKSSMHVCCDIYDNILDSWEFPFNLLGGIKKEEK
jgi:hypothetical protein